NLDLSGQAKRKADEDLDDNHDKRPRMQSVQEDILFDLGDSVFSESGNF
ncbi:hypothetical protein RF55_23879, partial [Lasius niger]